MKLNSAKTTLFFKSIFDLSLSDAKKMAVEYTSENRNKQQVYQLEMYAMENGLANKWKLFKLGVQFSAHQLGKDPDLLLEEILKKNFN